MVLGVRLAVVLEAGGQAAGQETGGHLVLVAEVPDADLLAGELARVSDAGVLPGHRQGARALEDLGDVDEIGRRRGLAGLEHLRDPADRELRAIGLRALDLGNDGRTARDHRDRQVLGREVALLVGREVAGELGLGRPLELEPDACGGGCRSRRRDGAGGGRARGRRRDAGRGLGCRSRRRGRRAAGERHRRGRGQREPALDLHALLLPCARPSRSALPADDLHVAEAEGYDLRRGPVTRSDPARTRSGRLRASGPRSPSPAHQPSLRRALAQGAIRRSATTTIP